MIYTFLLPVEIICDLSCDSRILFSQLLFFEVKYCRLIVWYSGSGGKKKLISLTTRILQRQTTSMTMGRSSRTYSIIHLLMRYDAKILDYSGIARSVAKVCKNDDFPAKSQTNVRAIQNADIISFNDADSEG